MSILVTNCLQCQLENVHSSHQNKSPFKLMIIFCTYLNLQLDDILPRLKILRQLEWANRIVMIVKSKQNSDYSNDLQTYCRIVKRSLKTVRKFLLRHFTSNLSFHAVVVVVLHLKLRERKNNGVFLEVQVVELKQSQEHLGLLFRPLCI